MVSLYAKAEFVVAAEQLDYLCYSHDLRALSPKVIATVRDYVCSNSSITHDTPNAYTTLKHVLLTAICRPRLITASSCWTLHTDITALLPTDTSILVNAIYL
jgi:hypothetical protein